MPHALLPRKSVWARSEALWTALCFHIVCMLRMGIAHPLQLLSVGEAGENVPELKEKVSLREAYSQLWAVIRLPSMRVFSVILITCRLGMLPAEQVRPRLLAVHQTSQLGGTYNSGAFALLLMGAWCSNFHELAMQAAPLKLLDKGVSKEALAGLVLLEFPCEMLSAVLAGRWAHTSSPFVPWMYAYRIRLVMAVLTTTVVSKPDMASLPTSARLL